MITDLHIAKYPEPTYPPYDTGVAGDNFVKNPDGSIYVGKVWPGHSCFRISLASRRANGGARSIREFKHDGVDGFWNDMNEPSVFKVRHQNHAAQRHSPHRRAGLCHPHRDPSPRFTTSTGC